MTANSPEQNSVAATLPIEASGVRLIRDSRAIVDGIDFRIECEPKATVVLGPNGAGKSVLARILCGLIEPDFGRVTWAGSAPNRTRARDVGLVFQRPVLFKRSVEDNVGFALGLVGVPKSQRRSRAGEILASAGLAHLARQDAQTLSAGEQQRVCLVRAIACKPRLLILDEPTANLDPTSSAAIETQLSALKARGVPLLLITHDLAQARRLGDVIVFMHHGRIIEQSTAVDFFSMPQTLEARKFTRGELLA